MERFKSTIKQGLNKEQVDMRIAQGLVNKTDVGTTKTYKQIFYDNIFTLFNFINIVLAILIFFTGSFKNLLFLGVVVSNVFLGIFQEVRAKRTLDRISLMEGMKVCVIREGKEIMIPMQQVVLDDIIKLKAGNQIPADCIVMDGTLEVDESLLSGESDTILKKEGDFLYSGSYVSGSWGHARVEKVGDACYASQMVKDARKYSRYPSELRDTLNRIIKYIGIMIIPLGLCLFVKEVYFLNNAFTDSILSVSAALIGMIPEGLVILTSVALAVGVIHLAKHRTLVQELYCLETLARVDVLCLDKTGTITEGNMEVADVVLIQDVDVKRIMGYMMYHLHDDNATYEALAAYFPKVEAPSFQKSIPFNSKYKYSGIQLADEMYLMGAYEYMSDALNEELANKIASYAKEGYRVLTLMRKTKKTEEVLALLLLNDRIRESAARTLAYFASQDVTLKVISGDHPITVSMTAKRAGLKGYDQYVDASLLSDEELEKAVLNYTVFGRVRPEQKKLMVEALQKQGHIVGMSGDGINDVLSFKSADVSIAMASGSDIAKSSANLVLLDSNFDALPYVLNEGRRVINNIQRVAALFLTKTIFSSLLSIVTLLAVFEYPFVPIHLTFVSTLTIGIPSFFMALEPNYKRVKKNFMENVMCISFPAGISVICAILYIYLMSQIGFISPDWISSLALVAICINGIFVLYTIAVPFTLLRRLVLIFASIGIVLGLLFGHALLEFEPIAWGSLWIHIVIIAVLLISIFYAISTVMHHWFKRK